MKRLLSMFLLSLVLVLSACGNDEPEKETLEAEEPQEQEEVEGNEVKDEPVVEEEPDEEQEEDSSWEDLKEADKIVGVSDKDFSKVTKSKPNDVRNDSTGNWRILKISENIDIEEYALSYADLYIKSDDEVHYVINFNYHTTTRIATLYSLVYVDVLEYVEKEEHDAKKLGAGMVLKSYVIFPDGDIQELDE